MNATDNAPFNEREFLTMAMLSSVELTRLWMATLGDRANSARGAPLALSEVVSSHAVHRQLINGRTTAKLKVGGQPPG